MPPWAFDPLGPSATGLKGPVALMTKGMGLPSKPGLYIVTCGDCMPHVGTSGNLSRRARILANLGAHRGSAEVLCAAFCTKEAPLVWWESHSSAAKAREREREFKSYYGEPPQPRASHWGCVDGAKLLADMLRVAGRDSWEAGFASAVFRIGRDLRVLFEPRFAPIWNQIGCPPGPWASLL